MEDIELKKPAAFPDGMKTPIILLRRVWKQFTRNVFRGLICAKKTRNGGWMGHGKIKMSMCADINL